MQLREKNEEYETLNDELIQANIDLLELKNEIVYPSKKEYDYVGKEKYRQIKETGTGVVETKFQPKDGTIIDVILASTALDIIKQKKAELNLVKAKERAEESDRLKTEFINNLTHDILEISSLGTKQERIKAADFNLNDLLMEIFSIFNLKSKERNIPLYVKKVFHDDSSFIITDRAKLNKIVCNLLENALKFTYSGFIEMGYSIEKTNLVLYVKDTGIGISPKNHERIFARFSQENEEISNKHGGLGLGLATSKENARLLGGTITLDSEKGKGSTFFVTLPYKPSDITNRDSKRNYEVHLPTAISIGVHFAFAVYIFYNAVLKNNTIHVIKRCIFDHTISKHFFHYFLVFRMNIVVIVFSSW